MSGFWGGLVTLVPSAIAFCAYDARAYLFYFSILYISINYSCNITFYHDSQNIALRTLTRIETYTYYIGQHIFTFFIHRVH